MTKTESDKINWTVVCVNEFARYKTLDVQTAFMYLYKFGGISFLIDHYEAEHTLSFHEAIEDLELICKKEGGEL